MSSHRVWINNEGDKLVIPNGDSFRDGGTIASFGAEDRVAIAYMTHGEFVPMTSGSVIGDATPVSLQSIRSHFKPLHGIKWHLPYTSPTHAYLIFTRALKDPGMNIPEMLEKALLTLWLSHKRFTLTPEEVLHARTVARVYGYNVRWSGHKFRVSRRSAKSAKFRKWEFLPITIKRFNLSSFADGCSYNGLMY